MKQIWLILSSVFVILFGLFLSERKKETVLSEAKEKDDNLASQQAQDQAVIAQEEHTIAALPKPPAAPADLKPTEVESYWNKK